MSNDVAPGPSVEHTITAEPRVERRFIAARSGAVTAIAVVNFVLGGLEILYGLYLLLGASLFGSATRLPGVPDEVQGVASSLAALAVALAILALLIGLLMEIAGWGLAMRKPWARPFTLILSGVAVLAALASLSPLNAVSLVLNVAYAASVFVVLLNPRYAAEFAQGSAVGGDRWPGAAPAQGTRGLPSQGPLVLIVVVTLCLGIALGWGFTQLAGSSSAAHRPLLAVLATDNQSDDLAKTIERALTRSTQIRVLDTSWAWDNRSGPRTISRQIGMQLGADLMVVVKRVQFINANVEMRVLEVQTGVLLASEAYSQSDERARSIVEAAAAKRRP